MISYAVVLSRGALRDLSEIREFVSESDSLARANELVDRFAISLRSLSANPQRGAHPSELRALGITEYRQVFFKPYRIIYRIAGRRVIVYVIADGRRDMQTLLSRRLFES
jgi:toxin ParE1/3/4